MKWFRVYDGIIDDPKVLRLSPELRWFYVGILAISSRQTERGTLPNGADIAIHLRITEDRARKVIEALIAAGLIEQCDGTKALAVHGWDKRQPRSDDVAERVRKHRSNNGEYGCDPPVKRDCNVTVSRQIRTDTEQIQNREDNNPQTPLRGNVVESSSSETEPPEYPDPLTTIVTVQPGEHTIPETEARKIWGHIWRQWNNRKLCFGFYEFQRWCSVGGWLYAIEVATKQGARLSSAKFLQKIGMDFDVNGPKREKPLRKGDVGSVPYVPTYEQSANTPSVDISEHILEAQRLTKLMMAKRGMH
jgi:hypothetical protein